MADILDRVDKKEVEKKSQRPKGFLNKSDKSKHTLVYSSNIKKQAKLESEGKKNHYQNFQRWQKKNFNKESDFKEDKAIREFKKEKYEKEEDRLKNSSLRLIEKIFKIKKRENYNENFKQAAELIKSKKIREIIVAGNLTNKNEPSIDLDTWSSLKLLNDYNKKTLSENYTKDARTTIVNKDFKVNEVFKNNKDKESNQDGIIIVIDTGGNWLKVINQDDKKETIVNIDHHGHGEAPDTSGVKMTYNLMKKAGILKEKSWQKDFIEAVNNVDNLNYLYNKDREGKYIFDKDYFINDWSRSLVAFVEKEIPFETTLKLFKEGKIRDISRPLSNYELNTELGNIMVKIKNGKDYQDMPLRKAIGIKRREVINSLKGAEEILKYNNKHKLLTEDKDLGNILYQNYKSKRIFPNGREGVNIINNQLAFNVLKAMGGDTYISYNQEKGYYYINSDYADLQLLAEVLNEKYPKSAEEVRGRFIFGKINKMSEEEFNNILKNFKNMAKQMNLRDIELDQKKELRKRA